MGLLDDLDLGKDPFNKEEPLTLKGFQTSLPNSARTRQPPNSSSANPELNWEPEPEPEEPPISPQLAQTYKDIKSYDKDLSQLGSDLTKYGTIHKGKKESIKKFHEETVTPFWTEQFSEGFLEAPSLTIDDPESIDKFFGDIDSRYEQYQKRVDEGDQNWFTEDEGLKRAGSSLKGKRKYDLIRQKHDRLLKDYHQSNSAVERATARKAAMTESLMSLPENVRWAAKESK